MNPSRTNKPTNSEQQPEVPAAPSTNRSAITIRQFRDEDLPSVIEIFADGFPPATSDEEKQMVAKYVQSSIESDLGNIAGAYITSGGNFWVATLVDEADDKEKVVGMVALEKKLDGDGELRRMSVKKEFRRYGVGKQLVEHLEQWAKQNGYTSVSLATGEVVKVAQAFYKRMGFEQKHTQLLSEEPHIAIIHFSKQL
uniref:N-acetyltransferase domain-containing protein n=1 Tax=Globisporangium ultimum (strain ATCC 200006 / CBS 805.95 / DAOM BR144) TaxID=431595 RepID=K3XAQ2_GLOUD